MTAQILITLTEQGCKVEGAIDNKVMAFGMLACAQEAISKHHARQTSGIVPASAADAAKLKIAGT